MYLAIDIGGTKTLLSVFTKAGELKESVKFKTPVLYDEFRDTLAENVAKLSTNKFITCCVAVPGKVDRELNIGVAFGNLPWTNVPIGHDVKSIINCEIILENDGNLAGLYEARQVPQYKKAVYVTISTGIGGVVIEDGVIQKSTQDAEIGHLLLEHDGKLQRWQEFASGKAIVKKYGKKASEIEVSDSAAWYAISRNIAIGLIDVIAMLTPDVIIIGGGVGTHFDKFSDRLAEELKIYENPLISLPPIIQAKHPEEAVVYGCYERLKDENEKTASAN
jgi:predicted NBD/HSP70 family sugar kinase